MSQLIFSIPLLGRALREVRSDPERAVLPFLINLILLLTLLTWIFGVGVIVATALIIAPAAMAVLVIMSSGWRA